MSPGYSGKKVGGGGAKVHTGPRARLARLAGAGAVYSQAQEDADAINAKQSSWTAAVYPQLQRRAWAEVINMRGGERWVWVLVVVVVVTLVTVSRSVLPSSPRQPGRVQHKLLRRNKTGQVRSSSPGPCTSLSAAGGQDPAPRLLGLAQRGRGGLRVRGPQPGRLRQLLRLLQHGHARGQVR